MVGRGIRTILPPACALAIANRLPGMAQLFGECFCGYKRRRKMFKVLRTLESYEFGASSKKNYLINRLVAFALDLCIAVAAAARWMGLSFVFSLIRYAMGAGLG